MQYSFNYLVYTHTFYHKCIHTVITCEYKPSHHAMVFWFLSIPDFHTSYPEEWPIQNTSLMVRPDIYLRLFRLIIHCIMPFQFLSIHNIHTSHHEEWPPEGAIIVDGFAVATRLVLWSGCIALALDRSCSLTLYWRVCLSCVLYHHYSIHSSNTTLETTDWTRPCAPLERLQAGQGHVCHVMRVRTTHLEMLMMA